jgi:hypothetical protein
VRSTVGLPLDAKTRKARIFAREKLSGSAGCTTLEGSGILYSKN